MIRKSGVTRRGFLQASMATLPAVATGLLEPAAHAQPSTNTNATADLEALNRKGPRDEAYWRRVRSQFLLNEEITFLNNGTIGPTSTGVIAARDRYHRELARNPYDSLHLKEITEVRQQLARFVNAGPDEVFFTHSTTDGMNVFAHGLDWKEGDEVLMARHEHPGGYQVYQTLEKRHGIKIVWLDLPYPPESLEALVEVYRKAITSKTRLIVVSHVTFVTGTLMPIGELAELAHMHGLLISVDGAQSFGVLPLDLMQAGCDHYAAPGQKWLLAGAGSGFTYIARSLQERVWPLHGYDDLKAPPFPILRYERSGQPNIPAWFGLKPALDLQLAVGRENIEVRARQLAGRFKEGLQSIPGVKLLTSKDARLSAALTTFSIQNADPEKVLQTLIDREGIYLRTIIEEDVKALRAATHLYNDPAQIDHLLAALGRIATSGRST